MSHKKRATLFLIQHFLFDFFLLLVPIKQEGILYSLLDDIIIASHCTLQKFEDGPKIFMKNLWECEIIVTED